MHNSYLQEWLAEEHRQELLREAEQRRLVAQVPQQQFSSTRHCLALVGQCLVMLGTHLKELETSSEHAVQQL